MAAITLAPPTWASGELLSASKLNALSDAANACKGASMGFGSAFTVATDTATYWLRRYFRYVHLRLSHGGSGDNLKIWINGNYIYNSGAALADQWISYDLDALSAVPAPLAFYKILIQRAPGRTLTVHEIRESSQSTPGNWGTYSTPSTWTGSETAAQYLSKLQGLSAAVASLAGPVQTTVQPAYLWAHDTLDFWRRRMHRYLHIYYVNGSDGDMSIRINNNAMYGNDNPTAGTGVNIDLAAVPVNAPAVGDFYRVSFIRNAGTSVLRHQYEVPEPPAVYAPSFAHGTLSPSAANYNAIATTLNNAQAILRNAGWQYAQIWRPYNHPEWSVYKTKRYLHYMRDGSQEAYLWEPSGVQERISLSRTDPDEVASYDLDTIDWLAPGGQLYAYECDMVWLDDNP